MRVGFGVVVAVVLFAATAIGVIRLAEEVQAIHHQVACLEYRADGGGTMAPAGPRCKP